MDDEHILIAHSDHKYLRELRIGLKAKGLKVSKKISNAFEALGYVIKYRPKLAILELDFSYLTAHDIMKLVRRKNINTQFILIVPENHQDKLPNELFFYMNDTIDSIEDLVLATSEMLK